MNLERKMLSLAFAGAALMACEPQVQPDTPDSYFTGKIEVRKTESHPAFEVYNAIVKPTENKNAGGNPVELSTIRFCHNSAWIDVPATETNFPEVAKNTNPLEQTQKGKQSSKPCEILLPNGTTLQILVFERK